MLGWVVKSRKEYHHRTALTRVRDAHATSPWTWTRRGVGKERLPVGQKFARFRTCRGCDAAEGDFCFTLLTAHLAAVRPGTGCDGGEPRLVVQKAHLAVERKMKRASYR